MEDNKLQEYKTKIKEHLIKCNKFSKDNVDKIFNRNEESFVKFLDIGYSPCTVAGIFASGLMKSA